MAAPLAGMEVDGDDAVRAQKFLKGREPPYDGVGGVLGRECNPLGDAELRELGAEVGYGVGGFDFDASKFRQLVVWEALWVFVGAERFRVRSALVQ